jgi:hypothetical protein
VAHRRTFSKRDAIEKQRMRKKKRIWAFSTKGGLFSFDFE